MNSLAISSNDIDRGVVDGLVIMYKKLGETPLKALQRLKARYPGAPTLGGAGAGLSGVTLSYAGRLDPLAEGVLVVLSGQLNKRREEFLSYDKTYEIEVLFGASTDTGDLLGLVRPELVGSNNSTVKDERSIESEMKRIAISMIGNHNFPYPIYSSKTVRGKPLHAWAKATKENSLPEIEIPTTKTVLKNVEYKGFSQVSAVELEKIINNRIQLVHGDFRQKEILQQWHEFLIKKSSIQENGQITSNRVIYLIAQFSVHSESGAYMRTLAEEIGKKYNTSALAFSIKRTKVGDFTISDCIF